MKPFTEGGEGFGRKMRGGGRRWIGGWKDLRKSSSGIQSTCSLVLPQGALDSWTCTSMYACMGGGVSDSNMYQHCANVLWSEKKKTHRSQSSPIFASKGIFIPNSPCQAT